MQKKTTFGLTAAALSSIIATSAAAQDQQADEMYQPSNPALESGRFHTGPELSVMPTVGIESYPGDAALFLGLEFCAKEEPSDVVSACIGGTYDPFSTSEPEKTEGLGMFYASAAFSFIPGSNPQEYSAVHLGLASRYAYLGTSERSSLADMLVPFIDLEVCAGQCVGMRFGVDIEEGNGYLQLVSYGIRLE